MRKFLMVVGIGALVLAMAAPAMALDFKFGGQYRVRFYTGINSHTATAGTGNALSDAVTNDRRGAQLRIRPRFEVSDDNGNIQAVLTFEIGDTEFGNGGGANGPVNSGFSNVANDANFGNRVGTGSGGGIDADGVAVEVKTGYVDAAFPFGMPLRVRAGIMPWFLPKGIVNDTDAAGVLAYGQSKPLSYNVGWYRIANGPYPCAPSVGTPNCAGNNRLDDNYDVYQARLDVALAPFFNPGVYYLYGRNASAPDAQILGWGKTLENHYLGATVTGKAGIVAYDFDFVYGSSVGGPAGNLGYKVKGWAADAGLHFPIGPVTLNLVGSYATGDKRDGGDSEAFPGGFNPGWNGPGGAYEMIGNGGTFDATEFSQDSMTNLWTLGAYINYVPVKPLSLKLAYAYAGFVRKLGNCTASSGATPANCFGPTYPGQSGKASLGQEVSLFATYTIWTGFAVQGEVGYLFSTKSKEAGAPAGKNGQEYALQLLYNF